MSIPIWADDKPVTVWKFTLATILDIHSFTRADIFTPMHTHTHRHTHTHTFTNRINLSEKLEFAQLHHLYPSLFRTNSLSVSFIMARTRTYQYISLLTLWLRGDSWFFFSLLYMSYCEHKFPDNLQGSGKPMALGFQLSIVDKRGMVPRLSGTALRKFSLDN